MISIEQKANKWLAGFLVILLTVTFCTGCDLFCSHDNTEVRNQRAATCTEEGYTGDIYCKDCGEMISEGKTIAVKEIPVEEKIDVTWLYYYITSAKAFSTKNFRDLIKASPEIITRFDFGTPKSVKAKTDYYGYPNGKFSIVATTNEMAVQDFSYMINGVEYEGYEETVTKYYDLSRCDQIIRKKFTTDYSLSEESGTILESKGPREGNFRDESYSVKGNELVYESFWSWFGAMGGGDFEEPDSYVFPQKTSCERNDKGQALVHYDRIEHTYSTGAEKVIGSFDVVCNIDGSNYTIRSWSYK